jgi:glycosyltransferase involved in cell wall biosynthesis
MESVLAQTMHDLELIVVDDGSTDDTALVVDRIAAADKRVRPVLQDNRGVSAARNRGLSVCRSPFVTVLDSDDLWHPEKLERQLREMGGSDGRCFVLTGNRRFSVEGDTLVWLAESFPPGGSPGEEYFRELLLLSNDRMQLINTALVPADAVRAAGGWREELSLAEDWDLWLRLASLLSPRNVMEPLYYYRKHTTSSTRRARYEKALDAQLEIIGRNGEAGRVPRGMIRKAMRRKYLEFAEIFRWSGNIAKAWQCTQSALFAAGWLDPQVCRSAWRCLTEKRQGVTC